jgi:translation initiation factor 2 alpha subunit (eIF-2alpha)
MKTLNSKYMSHKETDKFNDFKTEQSASIILSRATLERIELRGEDYWTFEPDEIEQVKEALKDMRELDNLEPIDEVPMPDGTIAPPKPRL